jgi:hypothetical protein
MMVSLGSTTLEPEPVLTGVLAESEAAWLVYSQSGVL